jgi:hypothetical protein
MTEGNQLEDLARRLAAVEARQEIGQLPIRYAIAIDSRNLELMAEQWAPDVWMGKAWGEGRPAVQRFYAEILQGFHRSIHMVVGHRIDLVDDDHASGVVYCRAEHEALHEWVVQAITYEDSYRRVDGAWGFAKRVHRHWYSWPMGSSPSGPSFEHWPDRGRDGALPDLPHAWPSWDRFWDGAGEEARGRHSFHPGEAHRR